MTLTTNKLGGGPIIIFASTEIKYIYVDANTQMYFDGRRNADQFGKAINRPTQPRTHSILASDKRVALESCVK